MQTVLSFKLITEKWPVIIPKAETAARTKIGAPACYEIENS